MRIIKLADLSQCFGQCSPCPRCCHQCQRRCQLGCRFHLMVPCLVAVAPAAAPPQQRPVATQAQRPQAWARPLQWRLCCRLCGELPPPTAAVQRAHWEMRPAQLLVKRHRCHCQWSHSPRCQSRQGHRLCCRLPVRLVSGRPHLRLAVQRQAPEVHQVLRLRRLWTSSEAASPQDISSPLCACDALGTRALPAAIEPVQRLPASVLHFM